VCRQRYVKGLYAKAQAGGVPQMTGVSAGFDQPTQCALELATGAETATASGAKLLEFARQRIAAGK
jgi:adenylylsulfate kinase-like enzyme